MTESINEKSKKALKKIKTCSCFLSKEQILLKKYTLFSTKSGALCAAKVLTDDKAAYFNLSKSS